jgi:hypothetical protein
VRGAASASAAGAGHVSADTAGTGSFRRCRTSGVATPTATAPHASRRRARVLRKAAQHSGHHIPSASALGTVSCRCKEWRRARRTRGAVDLARPLLIVSVLLTLAPAASAAPGGDSGGALAQPLRQGEGGGALAPDRYGTGAGGSAAVAEAAQEEPRTTPQWEEPRDREWTPYPNVEERPDGEAVLGAAEEPAVVGAEAAAVESETAAGRTGGSGEFLPWTGLEVAALAAIGLGILTLGVALRPRRRQHTRALR